MSAAATTRRVQRLLLSGLGFFLAWQVAALAGAPLDVQVALGLYGFVFHVVFAKAYSLVPSYFARELSVPRAPAVQLPLSVLGALGLERTPAEIILIDEIGKMECFSGPFTRTVRRLLDSDKTVIATVAGSGGGFISEVKGRSDVEVHTLSTGNRDTVAHGLVAELGA